MIKFCLAVRSIALECSKHLDTTAKELLKELLKAYDSLCNNITPNKLNIEIFDKKKDDRLS